MKKKIIATALAVAALVACDSTNDTLVVEFRYDGHTVGLERTRWYPASAPTAVGMPLARLDDADRQAAMWYNPEPALQVQLRDLYPDFDETDILPQILPGVSYGTVASPFLAFDVELIDAPQPGMWTGVMRGARGGADFSAATELAIWVNDFKPDAADRGGSMHIDIGRLDENFFEPEKGMFDDEDKARDGFTAAFDDTGLDGLFDAEEDSMYALGTPDDPHGDDLDLSRIDGRFLKANGTEANHAYDTEDLDASGGMERTESYYRLTIPLSSAAAIDVRAEHPDYDGWTNDHRNDAWRFYVVDIADAVQYATTVFPDLSDVRQVRIWFEDLPAVFRDDANEPGWRRMEFTGLVLRE